MDKKLEIKDKVLVSFCSYNAPYFIESLINSIERHDAGYDFDLLIYDNSSTDNLQLKLLENYSKKYRCETRPNHGRAQGAYDDAWQSNKNYKYYFFMHDDSVILKDNWLKIAVDRINDVSVEPYIESEISELPIGKVGFQSYEWGDAFKYFRTKYSQIFEKYIEDLSFILGIDVPKYYQHMNDDRFLIRNELLQKMGKIWNVELWRQMEIQKNVKWRAINDFFERCLPNKTAFQPNERYGYKYHAFQTVSEFMSTIAPVKHGYRTHCVFGDGYCQEELGWSKFWGNDWIVHWGSHVVFKRLAILLNTTEEVVREKYKDKTFLTHASGLISREAKNG
ncbi:MAG: glycosyltransferase [Candidatus Parcubacteria bacterium]|nr:glycosyltransferase [Candidatus Parcubacteria bacterium]